MKKENGISLVALIVTIMVLLLLAGVTFQYGKESIQRANLETLQTNMLLIKAKTMEYVEQANFKAGTAESYKDDQTGELKTEIRNELKGNLVNAATYSQIGVTDDNNQGKYLFELSEANLQDMGIKNIKIEQGEKYLVLYDIKNAKVEIYNTRGIEINGQKKYSLTDIQK